MSSRFEVIRAVALALVLGAVPWAHAMGPSGSDSGSPLDEAKAAIDAGDYDKAIAKLEPLSRDRPDDADVLNLLGYSHRQAGRIDRALEYYRKALAIDPEHKGANEYLGELYLKTDDLAKAEERLAVLDAACFFPCEEFRELERAIQDYKKAKGL